MSDVRLPELYGTAETAAELGVTVSNLSVVVGLPEPVQHLRCGRIWLAEDVRRFATEFRARRERLAA
jgi:hypothetical protein